MIKTFALDPELFARWDHHAALRDSFGVPRGRLIAKFPNDWKRLLLESCKRQVEEGTLGPIKAKTIEAWMSAPGGQVQRDSRFVHGNWPYQNLESWASNVEGCASAFDALLSEQSIDASNVIRAEETLGYLNDQKFAVATQVTVRRNKKALIDCVWPLVSISSKVRIVEPHFNPHKRRFLDTLVEFMDRLYTTKSAIREVELHVKDPEQRKPNEPLRFTKSELQEKIDAQLRSGYRVKVFLWADKLEKLHARYLLTEQGGLKLDWGWDEGEFATETTPVDLLTTERWQQEWSRYCIGSPDFELDTSNNIVTVGG